MTQIQRLGDRALLVNFEQKIAPQIHAHVTHLVKQIEQASFAGIQFCIPAYCSVTIGFDPKILEAGELIELLETWLHAENQIIEHKPARHLTIPVCYEGEHAPDMDEVVQLKHISRLDIMQLHSRTMFTVYMLGFIPGFAYMGSLPDALQCSRKPTPRLRVPTGSVGLAGFQTGIYPSEAPGGWQLIGRTPIAVFDANRAQPVLFRSGDQVSFQPISNSEFLQLEKKVADSQFDYSSLYE